MSEQLQEDLSQCRSQLARHDEKFVNGMNAMNDIRASVVEVREQSKSDYRMLSTAIEDMQPDRPDMVKIGLAFLTVGTVLVSVVLWASDKFSERPTDDQVRNRIEHTQRSLERLETSFHRMEVSDAESRKVIEAMQKQIEEQSKAIGSLSKKGRRR